MVLALVRCSLWRQGWRLWQPFADERLSCLARHFTAAGPGQRASALLGLWCSCRTSKWAVVRKVSAVCLDEDEINDPRE